MFDRLISRLLDWIIVIALVALVMWFFITQPLFSVQSADAFDGVKLQNLKNHAINLQRIVDATQAQQATMSAETYIHKYLSKLGKTSKVSFATLGGAKNNVRLSIGPAKSKQRLVIGTRYVPTQQDLSSQWNVSGLAVFLETARVLTREADKLPMRVDLIAYAATEDAVNGSTDMGSLHHARDLSKRSVDVKMMLSLKSVGVYHDEDNSQRYPYRFMRMLYPEKANFVALMSRLEDFTALRLIKSSFRSSSELPVKSINAPENFPMISDSDHFSFWLYDYPAVMVSDLSTLRYTDDKPVSIETMDYQRMAWVINGLRQTVLNSDSKSVVPKFIQDGMDSVLSLFR